MEKKEEKKVVKQEISEEDLNVAAGGEKNEFCSGYCVVVRRKTQFSCNPFSMK